MRRAGELLKQIEPAKTGPKPEIGMGTHTQLGRQAAGEQAGMSKHQQVQAVRVANVPDADFEQQVESPIPPTITTLAQQGVQKREAPDPETWLKGRNPAAFNKAMHFTALVEDYAKELLKADLAIIIPNLDERQAARVRKAIALIDPIHDTIATRI
jgi:hypothetical protein